MALNDNLKKAISAATIVASLSIPASDCAVSKKIQFEPSPVKYQLPLEIYVDTKSKPTKLNRFFDLYKTGFEELDKQAESAGVDLISRIVRYDKRKDNPIPGKALIIRTDETLPYAVRAIPYEALVEVSPLLDPKERVEYVKRAVLEQLIGKSENSGDLTFKGFIFKNQDRKLSERELFRLAELYGTAKIPRK